MRLDIPLFVGVRQRQRTAGERGRLWKEAAFISYAKDELSRGRTIHEMHGWSGYATH